MSIDVKIRLGLLLVSAAVAVLAALPVTHGLLLGFLDEIGGTTPG
jgi:hypothetical protein